MQYLSGAEPYTDRNAHPFPALMLLDLQMPKMGGYDLLAWLQSRPELAALPVIVLTGSIRDEDKWEAESLGAVGFEVKPVDMLVLVATIKNVVSRFLPVPIVG